MKQINCQQGEDVGTTTDNSLQNDANLNPMLNSVVKTINVLTRLFELCPLSDLPRFRLVSKEWHSLSLTRFRNEMSIVICQPSKSTLALGHISKGSEETVFEERRKWNWEELESVREQPFKIFQVKNIAFGHPTGNQPNEDSEIVYKNMEQFWGKYGQWMRKLELWHSEVHQVDLFKRAIFDETPNLEELHLIEIDDKSESNLESAEEVVEVQRNLKYLVVKTLSTLPVSWRLLFTHFPNIQKLEVTPTHKDSGSIEALNLDLGEISEQLRAKRDSKFVVSNLFLQLKTLEETSSAIDLIQIPLVIIPSLTLNFQYYSDGDEEMSLLSTVFLLQGHNLEKLHVTGLRVSPFDNCPFPEGPFTSVTKLDLSGNFCKNLYFLEHFPNLRYLGMVRCDKTILEETRSSRLEKTKLLQLKHFRFDVEDKRYKFRVTEEAMEMLVKLMPNVEVFYGKLSNLSLRVVCREWKKLKSLRIGTFSGCGEEFLTDEGITGIVEGGEERMPNITDLKDLKYLTIAKGEKISDASIWNAFLKMSQLQSLSVELLQNTSDEAFKALAKRFPNGEVTRFRWKAEGPSEINCDKGFRVWLKCPYKADK